MKVLVLLATLLAYGYSLQEPVDFKLNDDKEVEKEHLYNETRLITLKAAHIKYYFFSQNSPNRIVIDYDKVEALRQTDFSSAKEIVFVIHGWTNNHKSNINTKIKDATLKTNDVNVIIVDWSRVSRKDYITAQANVKKVGEFIADFVRNLVKEFKIRLDNVKFVGFSLGAHIAGNAGKALHGQVSRITGLDPAGPLFTVLNKNNRLDSSDAKFVQVIHTHAGGLGINFSIGHVDFWPNGGKAQPGCLLDLTGVCSHNLAYKFYAESVKDNKFVAKRCKDYATYKSNKCNDNSVSWMGGFDPDKSASGDYFLKTNRLPPYGQG